MAIKIKCEGKRLCDTEKRRKRLKPLNRYFGIGVEVICLAKGEERLAGQILGIKKEGKMTRIRIVVENNNAIPFQFEGESFHYIEIDTSNYGLDQITSATYNKLYDWARKNDITITAWDELEEILDEIDCF